MAKRTTSFSLAERLARALGFYIEEVDTCFVRQPKKWALKSETTCRCLRTWLRKRDILRGTYSTVGLLDLGTVWHIVPCGSLPKGITRDSSNAEIDFVLSVMGF